METNNEIPEKTFHCIISYCLFEKTSRPRAFICFLAFGTHDETHSLVFYILHENLYTVLVNVVSAG